MALSLCGVLGIALYFSESFLEVATEEPVAAEALWFFRVTMVYFLKQKSNLWFPVL